MLALNFKDNCIQYQNFAIWDVENMDAFFKGNSTLTEILKKDYKMSLTDFHERRLEIELTNMQIMEEMLDQIGDKHFFIFTYHDDHHWELVQLQEQKTMNFGVDIEHVVEQDRVYILVMDKKAEHSQMPH